MDTCNWDGYQFNIHGPNTNWNDIPGLYIFAKEGSPGYWNALYIGRASSLADRIPGHERWAEARQLGATHIHAMVERNYLQQLVIEQNLINKYKPPLNKEWT